MARLFFKTGTKEATDAWVRLTWTVAMPALALALWNALDENKDDYDKRKQWEKDNYFLIARYDENGEPLRFINDDGDKIREYWRIPKRGPIKWVGNIIEATVEFSNERNPETLEQFGLSFFEDLLPVNIQGEDLRERAESVISSMNPLIKVPYELISGRNTFYHSETIPRRLKGLSPRNQYRQSTPQIFRTIQSISEEKDIPILKDLSPIQLEQLTRGFTAGLVTQFIPDEPAGDRPSWTRYAIAKRFIGSSTVKREDEELLDALIEKRTEDNDERAAMIQEAESIFDDIKDMSRFQQKKEAKLRSRGNSNLRKILLDTYIDQPKGQTYVDGQIKTLGVTNGSRAEFLVEHKLKGLSPQEQKAEIASLKKRGLISDEVLSQIRKILKNK